MHDAPAETYHVERFGHDHEPVVIIDDFSPDPDALLDAATMAEFAPGGPNYPGIRARANARYLQTRARLLKTVLVDMFGMKETAKFAECNFSIVTAPPASLAAVQRLPHFDSPDPTCLAVLHYLCRPEDGGTAFYRHRTTGFERVDEARMPGYLATLRQEAEQTPPPPAYPRGDTSLFEQIGEVDARYNRLVIYRGQTLHSGHIPADLAFHQEPRKGRLTLNTFLFAR